MLICIEGEMGCGKTAVLTHIGYQKYLQGRKIISNYGVKFKHEKMSNEFLKKYFSSAGGNEDFSNACVLWDELPVYADSRRSASKKNTLISYLILQSRKRNLDIVFTAQDFSYVDIRLRKHTNMLIRPRQLGKTSVFKIEIQCKNQRSEWINVKQLLDLKSIFKLYDTYEIVYFE